MISLVYFRWITSCYGSSSDEQLMTFDQVVVQHHSEKNKWHQLIVSLVLPSEPHTAEVCVGIVSPNKIYVFTNSLQ